MNRIITDITNNNNNDLSNIVFNDELLYNNINNIEKLNKYLNNRFIYTSLQYDILLNDIEEYLKEIN
tara:strand:+ start:371 stop:571 length:201 start_codon:yes stop_codon:yes gene_type:complete